MYRIGIDLGARNIVAGVVDEKNRILGKGYAKLMGSEEAGKIVDFMKQAINASIKNANVSLDDVELIGVATPGSVDRANGVVEYASNLAFDNYPLRQVLQDEYNKKVFIENDANCAALGEAIAGAGNGVDQFVFVTIGNGIGAGIVMNGKLVRGCNDAAGEIGHMVIKLGGERCGCGRRGCWEAYASTKALIEQTKDAMSKNFNTLMWDMVDGDMKRVESFTAFEAMQDGDIVARTVVNQYIHYIAVGVVNVINIFQPKILCIGGSIGTEGESLLYPIRHYVNNEHYSINAKIQTQICAAVLGEEAALIGASLLED